MSDNEREKFEKIEFSIRMLHFHHYITDNQFIKMMEKFNKEVRGKLECGI